MSPRDDDTDHWAMEYKKASAIVLQAEKNQAEAYDKWRKSMRMKLENVARTSGFEVQDLFETKKGGHIKIKKPRKAMAVKYRDPKNPNNTWRGTGNPPRWLAAKIANGEDRETFRVKA